MHGIEKERKMKIMKIWDELPKRLQGFAMAILILLIAEMLDLILELLRGIHWILDLVLVMFILYILGFIVYKNAIWVNEKLYTNKGSNKRQEKE